ncbi:V-type ATP synthase subunit E [Atribacter laminatus]|uniref:V-type proton ATPase subunit E n=1 Tax=Atribacter laminatus TaxID=2847778 RepID=A0A7T1AN52_ATRLM|nr:V-type ATP synthase subunit E [Atribacter laminatus]QPM68961.1 V-type proton ATPase subunit E [Atribacter laminatus]
MSFEDILIKIEQEAQRRQKAILQNARLEAEKILEKANMEISQESERLVQQRTKESQLLVQRMLAEAKLKGRSIIGKIKSDAFQKVRSEVAAAFSKKITQSPEKWYTKIILNHSTSKDEIILMASNEADSLGEKFVKQLNQENKTSFRYGGLTQEIDSGLLLKKGGMVLNLSLNSLLEDTFRQNESQISQMLFKGIKK